MTSKNSVTNYEKNHANTRQFFNALNNKLENNSLTGGGPNEIANDLNTQNAAFKQLNELYKQSGPAATLKSSSQVISATFLQLVNKIVKIKLDNDLQSAATSKAMTGGDPFNENELILPIETQNLALLADTFESVLNDKDFQNSAEETKKIFLQEVGIKQDFLNTLNKETTKFINDDDAEDSDEKEQLNNNGGDKNVSSNFSFGNLTSSKKKVGIVDKPEIIIPKGP
jgi:hypothetical protein